MIEGIPGREKGQEQILGALLWTVAHLRIKCYWCLLPEFGRWDMTASKRVLFPQQNNNNNKCEWSMVSNASLRLGRTRGMASPSSRTSPMSALIPRMSVSVLIPDLYADCRLSWRPFLVKWWLSCCATTRLITLLINGMFNWSIVTKKYLYQVQSFLKVE